MREYNPASHMEEIDRAINKYAPIDLATGRTLESTMAINLRNIRHHAFSILCDYKNTQKQLDKLRQDMQTLIEFHKLSKNVELAYDNFIKGECK